MKPVRLLCYMFLWTWKCTTFKRIPIILIVLTNKNVALIYSVTICQQKTKDCALSRYFQHKLQHCCFYHWCLPLFHNQSPLITMPRRKGPRVHKDGPGVWALACHQCGRVPMLAWSPYIGWLCCWSFFMALRGFSPGTPVFPSPQKPAFPNSNFTRYQEDEERPSGYAASKSFLIKWFNIQIGTQHCFTLSIFNFVVQTV